MTVSLRCSMNSIYDLYEDEHISTNWTNMHIAPKKIFFQSLGLKRELICECLGFIERAWSLCRWWGGRQYFSRGSFTKKNPPVSLDIFSDAVFLDALASLKTMYKIQLVMFSRFQDYRVLESSAECYRVLQSVTECYRVLESFTECCRVLQSIAEYCRVLPKVHSLGTGSARTESE